VHKQEPDKTKIISIFLCAMELRGNSIYHGTLGGAGRFLFLSFLSSFRFFFFVFRIHTYIILYNYAESNSSLAKHRFG